eukprot:13308607-Alexandrium_andersonii.AAC.1
MTSRHAPKPFGALWNTSEQFEAVSIGAVRNSLGRFAAGTLGAALPARRTPYDSMSGAVRRRRHPDPG